MESKKYKNAARCFMMCSMEHCKFSDVSSDIENDICIYCDMIFNLPLQLISPYAVAVYGGLCALATFDRQDIYSKVLTSRLVT